MPHYLQATVTFPGILRPIRASYTLSHGQQPGRIIIACEPQPINLLAGAVGPVVFTWRNQQIVLRDCRVFSHNFAGSGESGFELNIFLMDRRWKWSNYTVFGRYNDRTADQSIYLPRKKNARQLAKILFEAMHETRYDLSGLPTEDWPALEWYGNRAADELLNLCDRYGCRLVMQWDGSLAIRKTGVGNPLPTNLPVSNNAESLDVPFLPDSIECHFGATKYRVDSLLKPVGLDVDGMYKDINDLSYAPKFNNIGNGAPVDPKDKWKGEKPGRLPLMISNMPAAAGLGLGATPQQGDNLWSLDLARRSIFRAYQISTRMPSPSLQEGKDLVVPGYKGGEKISSIDQLLPIDDTLYNITQAVAGDSFENSRDARLRDISIDDEQEGQFWDVSDLTMVYGDFHKKDSSFIAHRNTSPWPDCFSYDRNHAEHPSRNSYRPGGYAIDRERGIVTFDEPVYRFANSNNLQIAGIPLTNMGTFEFPIIAISFMAAIRNRKDFSPDHYVVKRKTTTRPIGTGPMVLLHPEYQLMVTSDLPGGSPRYPNKKMLDRIGNYEIDFAMQHFQIKKPRSLTYSGLWPINPDGAIMEVTISVGENGGDTVATYNNEKNPWQPSYAQKRAYERMEQTIGSRSLQPKVFFAPPQSFPYNMGSVYQNVSPSRRG